MKDFEPTLGFTEEVLSVWGDRLRGDEEVAVAFLASLAVDGPALELAIGTGRIALPLAARGVRVDGIDLSTDSVARLRAKPGGDALRVTMGDFADVGVDGAYKLIYVVFNTFFNLLTQDDQVRCFENVADHLTDDGVFVIEALTPGYFFRLRNDQYVDAEVIEVAEIGLDVLRHDAATQTIDENHVRISRDGLHFAPIVQRYAWPAELDLMARIAGLRLHDRFASWNGAPFRSRSKLHVSVYGR